MTLPDGFAALRVKDVVRETDDALSLVLDVPTEHAATFRYRAGQFLTLRVTVDGQEYRRCYSMSSSPVLQQDLRVTVKRDGRGVVSNWLNDHAAPGDRLEVGPPDGRFVRTETDRELVAFAGGSGITPVFSLIQTALAAPAGRVRLLYANRAAGSIIFENALADLAGRHGGRFTVAHHLDEERGVLTAAGIPDVRILDGGLRAWRGELHTGTTVPEAGDVTVVHDDLYAGALPTVTAEQAATAETLLDARAPECYRGETEPVDPVAGHIPGARNVPSTALLTDGALLPATALQQTLGTVGDDAAVYCGSGVTASLTVAVLVSLGIDAALFPGSWSQWSAEARPVAVGEQPR